MVVVDIDPRHGGDAAMRRLTNRHGRLPVTWTARTGGGGWHYWFRVGDIETRARLCEGVDIKHGGSGYVVVPPSRVACRYRWLREPVNEPAVAPDWLREALVAPRYERPAPVPIHGAAQFGLECLLARIAAAPAGSRNKTVFGACRDALRQGNFDAFESALMEAAVARGLTLAEVAAIVRSARRGAL
ncbi:hypothetical protein A5680_06130 [Mycobacterium sp. E2989]|nr:hypothetical protein A5680_06130 [Mycobacterium sp. E2989]